MNTNTDDLNGQLLLLRAERDALALQLQSADAALSELAQYRQQSVNNYNGLRLAMQALITELRPFITQATRERGQAVEQLLGRFEAALKEEA
jgi:hypothetical protein